MQVLVPKVTALREQAAATAQINRDLTSQRTQIARQLALCTTRTAATTPHTTVSFDLTINPPQPPIALSCAASLSRSR